jgi:hypothetical protein
VRAHVREDSVSLTASAAENTASTHMLTCMHTHLHINSEMQARAERAESALAALQAQIASEKQGHQDSSHTRKNHESQQARGDTSQSATRRGWAHTSSASSCGSRSSSSCSSALPKSSSPGDVLSDHHRNHNDEEQGSQDSDSDNDSSSWSDDDGSGSASHRRGDVPHPQDIGGNSGGECANIGDIRGGERSKTRRHVDGAVASIGSNDTVHDEDSSDANAGSQNKRANSDMPRGDSDTEHKSSNHVRKEGAHRAVRCRQMLLGSATVSLLSEAVARWFEPSQSLRLRQCRRAFTAFADACERTREEKGTERGRELEEQCRLLKSQVEMLTSIKVPGKTCEYA